MDNETLKKDTEASQRISCLTTNGTVDDLPELYGLILDNMEIATKEEISILLKAMGAPDLTDKQLTKRDEERSTREIQRQLSVSLAFAKDKQTPFDFKSERKEILRWAKQINKEEKNPIKLKFKELNDKIMDSSIEYDEGDNALYKKIHRLFHNKSHYPTPLREFELKTAPQHKKST